MAGKALEMLIYAIITYMKPRVVQRALCQVLLKPFNFMAFWQVVVLLIPSFSIKRNVEVLVHSQFINSYPLTKCHGSRGFA